MKADNVQSVESNNAELDYITLPPAGIQLTNGEEQTDTNAYQSEENSYVQNQVYSGLGNFGYSDYAAAPNCSYCCDYDSNDSQHMQQIQGYGYATQTVPSQVEYQYDYGNQQSDMTQYYNVNRVAGGREAATSFTTAENYPATVNYAAPMNYSPTANQFAALNYQATNEQSNLPSYACNMQQAAQSHYFSMPTVGNTVTNPEYWYSAPKTNQQPNQSVYGTDYQGNNFNHFPNNHFMDKQLFMELSQSNSEPVCDVANPVSANYGIPNVSGMQMQSYPITNVNIAQMCSS